MSKYNLKSHSDFSVWCLFFISITLWLTILLISQAIPGIQCLLYNIYCSIWMICEYLTHFLLNCVNPIDWLVAVCCGVLFFFVIAYSGQSEISSDGYLLNLSNKAMHWITWLEFLPNTINWHGPPLNPALSGRVDKLLIGKISFFSLCLLKEFQDYK